VVGFTEGDSTKKIPPETVLTLKNFDKLMGQSGTGFFFFRRTSYAVTWEIVAPTNPKKDEKQAPRTKIKPLNGLVSVGGGFENKNGSNLNPIKPGSGGPTKDIPNHVPGRMEDMAEIFEAGSVKKMISSRLRYADVDWPKGTQAAGKVMASGGVVEMNVWCNSAGEKETLKPAFNAAGFTDVRVEGDSVGTMIYAKY
jgi:hypothetical protein